MKRQFTRSEKALIQSYALDRERENDVVKVRFLSDGDTRAFCKDGTTYLIAPTVELFAEAEKKATR